MYDSYKELAKPYYSKNENHFHNFRHAEIVTRNAQNIIKKL